MSEYQLLTNHTTTERIELQTFDLPQNYSILINKLERLALGLDSAFNNLSLGRKEVEIAVSNGGAVGVGLGETEEFRPLPPPPVHAHGMGDIEYSRVVSDIWIGVILTLLIVSVIFFICSCFLYHKFQQWKNSYQTNPDPIDLCRRCPNECEAESLPSYTIVSGLPTYDDALEEFRKAGIILTPQLPAIKIFETDTKDPNILNMENSFNDNNTGSGGLGGGSIHGSCDNISLSSTCTCGAGGNGGSGGNGGNGGGSNVGGGVGGSNVNISAGLTLPQTALTPNNSAINLCVPSGGISAGAGTQIIELSPEQLAQLSQKRLSLQIAFNGSPLNGSILNGTILNGSNINGFNGSNFKGSNFNGSNINGSNFNGSTYNLSARRNSRPRIDLYREANRNNHMRARAFSNVGLEPLAQIHRSASSTSLAVQRSLRHLQHRGSIC